MKSYKPLFSRALAFIPAHRHAAAHSHHLRPDVVEAAQNACTLDSFRFADLKWDRFFGEVYPLAQAHVARALGTGQPDGVVFASNTHELLLRLLSCLPTPARILTSDSEFHSAGRQFQRLEEAGLVRVTRIPTEPFPSFHERFAAAAAAPHDLVFLSHVFYNSGYVVPDLDALVSAVPSRDSLIVIDGYHAFMALPIDISRVKDRIFYLAGGYKYAMSGEGACFMHAPDGYAPRPVDTGWFAGFEGLGTGSASQVSYPSNATRFAGASLAPDGIYRFEGVLSLLQREGIDSALVHDRVRALQRQFLDRLSTTALPREALLVQEPRGNFLAWRTERAGELRQRLLDLGIISDHRQDRLRLGFGLYHDPEDINLLAEQVNQL
jgi:kynureninase